jgi:hypothetical protein
MNQIDLILENIRLGHINQLILEATTPDEVNRGVALINESMQTVYGALFEGDRIRQVHIGAIQKAAPTIGAAGLGGAAIGAGLGYALGDDPETADLAGLGGLGGAVLGAGGAAASYANNAGKDYIARANKRRAFAAGARVARRPAEVTAERNRKFWSSVVN